MRTITTSPARAQGARLKGARSCGPTTVLGKSISSMNAVKTGVDARCVLMPGETLDDHQQEVDIWVETLRPATAGEARIAAAIADLLLRLGRVDQAEDRRREFFIETELRETEVFKNFSAASDALSAVQGLAETAESITTTVPFEHLGQLTPAMRRTLEMVEDADVPVALLLRLRDALNGVSVAALLDAGPEEFAGVAIAARDVEAWLTVACAALRAAVEDARIEILADPTLGDEVVLRRLDRHRARLHRQLDRNLDLLKKIRELASVATDSASSFVRVELRVVARSNLAPREG